METRLPVTAATPTPGGPAVPGAQGLFARLSADLSAGADLEELLHRFLEPLMRLAGADAGVVRMLSADGRRLQMVSQLGLPESVVLAEQSVDPACGICGAAYTRDQIVCGSDLALCARHADPVFFGQACRQIVAVPLTHRGNVLGAYTLFRDNAHPLSMEAAALLRTIGEMLGLALHNAKLERENLRATVVAERQAMAAEVHDSLAQTLAFVKMRMPLLEHAVQEGRTGEALAYCADVRDAASLAHTNLRHILRQFRVPIDPQGLKHALYGRVQAFQTQTQIALAFDDRAPDLWLTPGQEAEVFGIVQEALANVAKHAGASRAWMSIECVHGEVHMVVEDDGTGLSLATQDQGHYGLDIMRERAARLGGRIELGHREGGGTRLSLRFPMSLRHGAPA